MQGYHAGYAGLLRYLSKEFRSLAHTPDGDGRFIVYANVLERISTDLMAADGEQAESPAPLSPATF
ncbi:MAG: hypothetical protein ACTSX7_13955 [Alphaproteobacteria bacterium]